MKKTHRIYARDKNAVLDGLKTSKGTVEFGTNTAVYVDESTAKEVDERYGMNSMEDSVLVAKDEQYDRALNGESWEIIPDRRGDWVKTLHKYRFQGVDTSHFVKRRNGDIRIASGVKYVWMSGQWIPKYELLSQKRTTRRKRR